MMDYGEHKTGIGSIKTAYVYDGIQRYSWWRRLGTI